MGERKVKNGLCSANEKRNLCRTEKIVITKPRMRVKERKEHRINVEKSYNRIQFAKLKRARNNHHKPPQYRPTPTVRARSILPICTRIEGQQHIRSPIPRDGVCVTSEPHSRLSSTGYVDEKREE